MSGAPRARRLALGLALLASGAARPAPAATATVDYLAVEANEGFAAGGHVGLRLGDAVFHLQHDGDGLLRLRRDPAIDFRLHYALFENRPVHVTRLAVGEAAVEALRQALMERLLREDAERRHAAAGAADVALFALLARRAGAAPHAGWPVRAAGYFVAAPFASGGEARGTSPALAALRARVVAAGGAEFLARERAAVRAALAALPLTDAARGGAAADGAPPVSTRVSERLEQLTALEILAAAPALRADALAADPDAPRLAAGERAALVATLEHMTAGLARLPGSSRPDWGYPLLLGLARLAAIEAALAADRLLVLDAWPADAPPSVLPPPARRADYFAALGEQTDAVVARERAICLGGERCREADYARLESALNRRADVAGAARAGGAPRAGGALLTPQRPAARRDLGLAPLAAGAAAAAGAQARHAAADYRAELRARQGYQLVARNCVTELLAVLDGAGGRQARRPPWQAIPFVSAAAVAADFPVVGRETWPSFRGGASPAGWSAWLAEQTTLTASRYRPSGRDSTFLFFTDGALAPRPLFGAVNLAVGLADGLVGLATWPFDDARRLRAGFGGALYSLPELAFVNLRKGTTAYVTESELAATLAAASPRSTSSAP